MVLWRSCLIDETLRESELWPESYPPESGGWVLNLPKCCSIENHILHTFAFLLRVIEVFFFDTCELVLINVHVCAEKHWSVWNVGFFCLFFFLVLKPAQQCRTRSVHGPLEIELTGGEQLGRNMLNLGVGNYFWLLVQCSSPWLGWMSLKTADNNFGYQWRLNLVSCKC